MHPLVVFRFDRPHLPGCLVAVALAVGPGCSASSTATPAGPAADGGTRAPPGIGGVGGTDAAAFSGGGGALFADAATADASDSGPTCTGDGGPQTFTCTGSLSVARDVPAGAGLPDGTVLVSGGWNQASGVLTSAEIYEPLTGSFAPAGSMASGHLWGGWGAPLPVLPNGAVLVAGGLDASGQLSDTAELYDPSTRTFSTTGTMAVATISMNPVLLEDGSVLYVGGWDSVLSQTVSELPGWSYAGSGTAAVERYYPAQGVFRTTGSLAEDRLFGCNVRLPNGDVLAIAGAQGPTTIEHGVEQYDVTGGRWTTIGSFTGAPFCAGAFALPNGKVLLTGTGGLIGATLAVPGVALFDPAKGAIGPTMDATAGFSPVFVQLASGDVLALGGTLNGAPTATAQVYAVATNAWRTVGSLNQPRGGAVGAFLLASGAVLVVGGTDQNGAPLATAEIYHP